MDAHRFKEVDLEITARLDVEAIQLALPGPDGKLTALFVPRAAARQIAYFLLRAADRLEGRILPRCPFPWAVRRS